MIGQCNVTFDTVGKGQAWCHGTPDFDALLGRGITEEILTVAGPPSFASVALRRRLQLQSYGCIKLHCCIVM